MIIQMDKELSNNIYYILNHVKNSKKSFGPYINEGNLKFESNLLKLYEQIYKMKKVYYHSSPNKFDSFSSSPVYISTSLDLIKYFYKSKFQNNEGFLYSCKFIKNLDLFNANCDTDYKIIIPLLSESSARIFIKIKSVLEKQHPESINKKWMRLWSEIEKSEIQKIIKSSGYDGFSANNSSLSDDYEFVSVYDPKNLKIIKREKFDFS